MSVFPRWALRRGEVIAELHRVPTAWADAVISAPPACRRPPSFQAWLTMVLGQCRVIAREEGSLVLLLRARDVVVYVHALQDAGWMLMDVARPSFPGGRFVVWAVKGAVKPGARRVDRGRRRFRERLRAVVRRFTPVGGQVLDPFAGSAAVALVTVAEGRSLLGVEECARRYGRVRQRLSARYPTGEDTEVGALVASDEAWPGVRSCR